MRTIGGRYALEEAVGGSSWRAIDTELGRQVLVRLGHAGGMASATLSHPNIARLFDQGEEDGESYAVLEYLPGGTLEARLPELGETDAHAAAAGIADGLAYAHGQGVAHGSLSSKNVLLDGEGRPKLAGFGAGGTPEDDVRAFGAILQALARIAPALAGIAAAAVGGELAADELPERIRAVRPTAAVEEETVVIAPPARQAAGRRTGVLVGAAGLALLAAGVGAAFLATGDSPTSAPTTGSLSVPVPTTPTTGESEEPPPSTETEETTTTTASTSTEPPPTTAPTTAPPPATTEPPPPTTTEEPPPTTTEEPPPTTEPPPATTDPAG